MEKNKKLKRRGPYQKKQIQRQLPEQSRFSEKSLGLVNIQQIEQSESESRLGLGEDNDNSALPDEFDDNTIEDCSEDEMDCVNDR